MSNIIFKLHLTALLEQLECENIYVQYNNITLDLPVQQESDKLGSLRNLCFVVYFLLLVIASIFILLLLIAICCAHVDNIHNNLSNPYQAVNNLCFIDVS